MKTTDEAKRDLLIAVKHIRGAVEIASKRGSPRFAVLSERPDGSGKIECRFDTTFIEDLAMLIDAPALTDADRMEIDARRFRDLHGL